MASIKVLVLFALIAGAVAASIGDAETTDVALAPSATEESITKDELGDMIDKYLEEHEEVVENDDQIDEDQLIREKRRVCRIVRIVDRRRGRVTVITQCK